MAKIKVKKESVLKLRFTEHSGQEWELWENFCRDLCDLFETLAFKGFRLNVAAKSQGLIWIHQETAEKALDKEIIKELAQKHSIEIEFEEEKKEEKKRPTAHEIATILLKQDPEAHLSTIAEFYSCGGKVPKEGIQYLITCFEFASQSVKNKSPRLDNMVKAAIKNLKQQQKEG